MPPKPAVLQCCIEIADEKIDSLKTALAELKESLRNETKSTAGDKYETARAMVHIEQENLSRQLVEALAQRDALAKTDISMQSGKAIPGSLVTTDRGCYFISSALGKLLVDEKVIFAISPQSPLGSKLIGLSAGSAIEVNGMQHMILKVE